MTQQRHILCCKTGEVLEPCAAGQHKRMVPCLWEFIQHEHTLLVHPHPWLLSLVPAHQESMSPSPQHAYNMEQEQRQVGGMQEMQSAYYWCGLEALANTCEPTFQDAWQSGAVHPATPHLVGVLPHAAWQQVPLRAQLLTPLQRRAAQRRHQ